MSKAKGISLCLALVFFGVFSFVLYFVPLPHGLIFWLGYGFEAMAFVTLFSAILSLLGKSSNNQRFFALPTIKLAWSYLVLQTIASVWEMVAFPLPYWAAMTVNLVLATLFISLILITTAATDRIRKNEGETARKVFHIRSLSSRVALLQSDDATLSDRIKQLAEDIRMSDPMSHSQLGTVEQALLAGVTTLESSLTNPSQALSVCEQLTSLLKQRHQQCLLLKGVEDTDVAPIKGGGRYVLLGMAIVNILLLIVLTVAFIVVPAQQYTQADELERDGKAMEAASIFYDLGAFRNSGDRANDIYGDFYDEAIKLMENGQREEAIDIRDELADSGNADTYVRRLDWHLNA